MATMTNDDVRRWRLDRLIDEAGGVGALAGKLGISASQVSQWRNASPDSKTRKPRGMSDGTARRMEHAFGKHTGWFDTPPSDDELLLYPVLSGHAAMHDDAEGDAEARIAILEEAIRAGAKAAGVTPSVVVGSIEAMRKRVRLEISGEPHDGAVSNDPVEEWNGPDSHPSHGRRGAA